jgi:hypothetical protein
LLQSLIENVPHQSPETTVLKSAIYLATTNVKNSAPIEIFPVNTVLPIEIKLNASLVENKGFLQILVGDNKSTVGEVVFTLEKNKDSSENNNNSNSNDVEIAISVNVDGQTVLQVTQSSTKIIVADITVPAAAK